MNVLEPRRCVAAIRQIFQSCRDRRLSLHIPWVLNSAPVSPEYRGVRTKRSSPRTKAEVGAANWERGARLRTYFCWGVPVSCSIFPSPGYFSVHGTLDSDQPPGVAGELRVIGLKQVLPDQCQFKS